MFHIALIEPEIPENTGNIIRLVANVGAVLHLVRPYGFIWDEKRIKSSAMDYLALAEVHHHNSLEDLLKYKNFNNIYTLTTKADGIYTDKKFAHDDLFMFGAESRGLAKNILDNEKFTKIKIPMLQGRSINLANSVAVVAYETVRQIGF